MQQTTTKPGFPCTSTAAERTKSAERPQFYRVNLSERKSSDDLRSRKSGKQVQSCLNRELDLHSNLFMWLMQLELAASVREAI